MLFKKFFSPRFSEGATTAARLELALEAAGLVDWDFDYEKNTAHRSLKHDQLYGYSTLLPQWNFDNFFHHVLPEYHAEIQKKFEDIVHVGRIDAEFRIRRVDGSIRWILLKGKGQKNENGKVVRVAGILRDITDDKLRTEHLEVQNKNLRSLFSKSTEFFCVLNKDLIYEYVNPSHVRLFEGRNLTGLSVQEAQPELKDSPIIETLKNILRTGEHLYFEEMALPLGNRMRYLNFLYAPRMSALGEIDGIFALGVDVSDRVNALKQAKLNEAHLRLITDKLPAFVSYTDNHGRYQFLNAMYEKWFEKPISEMLGKTREEITPPDYYSQARLLQDNALDGLSSHHMSTISKPNGESLNLDINFVPDIDPETKDIRGMIAVGVNVTEQVRATKSAELARQELHDVLMQAPAPMCLLSGPDHVFTIANPEYEKFVGRKVMGMKLADAFANEDITVFSQIIKDVYLTAEPRFLSQIPLELVNSSGQKTQHYLNAGYSAFLDVDGKPRGVLVIVQDVTEQVTSVIARDNFMGIASHELKTPLTAMKLQTQMNLKLLAQTATQSFDSARLERIFTNTSGQINRLIRLVDDMLDVSRISADKLSMNFIKTDLGRILKETLDGFEIQLADHVIKIQTQILESVEAEIDEERMIQVFTNLITNAMKYAPHSTLSVTLTSDAHSAFVTFQDTGPGIDKSYHEKIFDRFERVSQNRDTSSFGLGLFITKKIVESHLGSIDVESELGRGTRFSIAMPLKQPSKN
jgi:PAS domain S-box-containing protein